MKLRHLASDLRRWVGTPLRRHAAKDAYTVDTCERRHQRCCANDSVYDSGSLPGCIEHRVTDSVNRSERVQRSAARPSSNAVEGERFWTGNLRPEETGLEHSSRQYYDQLLLIRAPQWED